ncbi:FbpB family small basic protein [Lederbergia citrea]|uniref:FbpB family small basic protein n=1 Tax=Lederbergia citrea TaxID=2833581 RepID=A0A942ULB6_9BACI|nr:FbpB family small basic protein [Lederbergia citrea]MBS4176909.1 FbpB family small basic protein [Lederbergia citrea]MBS4203488.1 FbpB family small basic protein [Lederbergia citrea]MBS4221842.1 FbpB family small basic protein [Lederbergia citrea]
MRRPGKKNFSDLIQENRQALLKDLKAMERIEDKLEEKHMRRA